MILVHDLPQKQVIDATYGLEAPSVSKYDNLSKEILIGQILIGVGITIIIPGIILKQK